MTALFARSFLVLMLFLSLAGAATSSLDTVDIVATGVTAQEGGTPGRFTLSRTGSSGFLTVTFTLEGSATYALAGPTGVGVTGVSQVSNKDYRLDVDSAAVTNGATTSLPTVSSSQFTVTFAPGQQNIDILVTAFEDGVKELQEDVRLRLLQNPAYIVGGSSVATVTIADNDILVTLNMPDQTLSEFRGDPSPEGNFEAYFNDWTHARFLVMKLEGAATRSTDYSPKAMFMHQPTSGEVDSISLNGITKRYIFTPAGGSLQDRTIAGSGWYVSTPPDVIFDSLIDAERISSIDQLKVESSDSTFSKGSTIVFNAIGTTTAGAGARVARGYGTVDASGQLILVRIIDPGIFLKSDIDGVNASLDFFADGIVAKAGLLTKPGVAKATATIVAAVPGGSQARGVAVLNGIVTGVTNLVGGSLYTTASVSFVAKVGNVPKLTAVGTATVLSGAVTAVVIKDPGEGYTEAPDVVITGDGSGAGANAVIEGPVLRVDVVNAGLGYSSVPGFIFTRTDGSAPTASAISGISRADANPGTDFVVVFNGRVNSPDFFSSRSSGQDDRFRRDWQAKLDVTDAAAASINKKDSDTLTVTNGRGPLTVGDVVSVGTDGQLYFVTKKSGPIVRTAGTFFKLTVSPRLVADVADNAVITNALSVSDITTFLIPSGGASSDVVGYYAMDMGITPVDDALVEGAETVTLRLLANNDYAIENPTVQTMEIADDDAIANIELVNNGTEPNLSGQVRVTLSNFLTKDITIPFLISGTATPGAGLDSDLLGTTGTGKQREANTRDYTMTGLVGIAAPLVDPITGAVITQASARGSVTIPAGTTSVNLIVNVKDDVFVEGSETVVITLQRSNDVVLAGTPSANSNPSATVNISDNLGVASVLLPESGIEGPTAVSGKVRFIMDGNKGMVPTNVGVGFNLSGTATLKSDFTLAGTGFTLNPSTGDGSAVLRSQEPIEIVDLTTVTGSLTLKSGTGEAVVDVNSTVVIGGRVYKVTSVSAPKIASNGTTGVTVQNADGAAAVFDAVVGKVIKIDGAPKAGAVELTLKSDPALKFPAHAGLFIAGRIYVTLNSDVISFGSDGKLKVGITTGLIEDVAADTPVTIAFRVATDLIIQTLDDVIAEGPESVQINLKTGSGYSISGVNSAATVPIIDDEPLINVTVKTDAFEPRTPGQFEISYTRPDGTALNRSVEVFFGVVSPSAATDAFGFAIKKDANGIPFSVDGAGVSHFFATPGVDYQAITLHSQIIPAGSKSATIDVSVISDLLVEQPEEVQLFIQPSPSNAYTVNSGIAAMVINDAPLVSVEVPAGKSAVEGGAPGVLRFSRTKAGTTPAFKGDINVVALILGDASTAVPADSGSNNDFKVGGTDNPNLSFPAGESKDIILNVTIPDTVGSVDVPISVLDDLVADRGEFLVVALQSSFDYRIDSTKGSATLLITDAQPAIAITALGDANEGGENGGFRISLASPVPSSNVGFKVPLHFGNGAVFGSSADYTITVGGVAKVLDSGNNLIVDYPADTKFIDLVIIARARNGTTDPVQTLTLAQAFGPSILGGTSRITFATDSTLTASIRIIDDLPVISLQREPKPNGLDVDLTEPSTNGSFRVVSTVKPISDLVVNFAFPGSGDPGFATFGTDYTVVSGLGGTVTSVVIKSGTNSALVTLRVNDDTDIEGIEGIDIALATHGNDYAIDQTKAKLSLLLGDDEFTEGLPKISVIANVATAYEEKRIPGTFTLTRSLGVGPMIVGFALSGKASAEDYVVSGVASSGSSVAFNAVTSTGTVTFAESVTSVTVKITPVDDALAEGVENVIFSIVPKAIYEITERSSASIDIADNDIITTLTVLDPLASETFLKAGLFRITSLPSNIDRDVTFRVDGTAKLGKISDLSADYALRFRNQGQADFTDVDVSGNTDPGFRLHGTLRAGVDFVDFEVAITRDSKGADDIVPEGRETAIFTLEDNNQYAIGSPKSGLVTIADNDVQVTLTPKDGGEPSTSGSFTVALSSPLPFDLDVPFTVSGTATPGVDYDALQPLKIKAGEITGVLVVNVLPDNNDEPTETVKLTLANSLDYVVSGGASATVNIADLYGTISVVASAENASESFVRSSVTSDADISRFRIHADRIKPNGFTVSYALTGSATSGLDYVTPSSVGNIGIPAGVTDVILNIDPLTDAIFEGDETVTLTIQTGAGYSVDATKGSASLVIKDSAPIVSLAKLQDGAEPGTPIQFGVSFPGPSINRNLKVFYQVVTAKSTATPGSDFVFPSDSFVTIPSGQNSVVLSLSVLDDQIVEDDETVVVRLLPDTGTVPVYGVDAANAEKSAIIADDEPTVSIATPLPPASVNEGDSFNIILSYPGAALNRDVNVSYILSGTAEAGSDKDYTIASTISATILKNTKTVTIPVSVVDDTNAEDPESIIFTLADNPTGGYRLGAVKTIEVDISLNDDALPIQVTATKIQDATETGTQGIIEVSINRTTLKDLTVPFTVSGTATKDVDYSISPASQVVIRKGQTKARILIDAVADGVLEADESVSITINLPLSVGFNVSAGTATALIKSNVNDGPPNGSLVSGDTGGKGGCGSGGGVALVGGLAGLLLLRRRRA